MSGVGSSGVGRIYIKAGSEEIDLSGSAREVNDAWLNITKQDTWQSRHMAVNSLQNTSG